MGPFNTQRFYFFSWLIHRFFFQLNLFLADLFHQLSQALEVLTDAAARVSVVDVTEGSLWMHARATVSLTSERAPPPWVCVVLPGCL